MNKEKQIDELTTATTIFKQQLAEKTVNNKKRNTIFTFQPIPKFSPTIHVGVVLNGVLDLSILKKEGYNQVKEIGFKDAGIPPVGGLTTIFNIPDTIEIFKCPGNRLNTISPLPHGLKELDIERNQITDIDFSLIPNLKKLNISNNQFEELKNLPAGLKVLNCSHNEIRYIDLEGANELTHLYINDNKIVSVSNIPLSLKHISYYNNPLKEIESLKNIPGLVVYDEKGSIVNMNKTISPKSKGDELYETKDKENMSSNNPTTNIIDEISYKEAITQYFKMKKEYENGMKSKINKIKSQTKDDKKKRRILLSSVKGNCVVCKRNVGSIFKKKNNYYIALCGDVGRNPCRLNIRIFNGETYDFFDDMHYFKEYTERGMEEIIKQKMDVLFNYLTDKKASILFDKALKKYKDYNSGFTMLYDSYKEIYENPAKTDLLRLKNENVYSILAEIDERIVEYNKTPTNRDLLREVVEIQQRALIPALIDLRNSKYERMTVVCDSIEKESNSGGMSEAPKCTLIQSEHNIDNFIYVVEEPKVIRFDI